MSLLGDMGSHVPRAATKICNLCEVSSILTGSIPHCGDSREMFYGGNVMTRTVTRRASLLSAASKRLNRLGSRGHIFTADDVQAFLNENRFRGNRLSFIQSLLNGSNFFSTGVFVPSGRPVARGRRINVWTTY